jgi:hypothetical protein
MPYVRKASVLRPFVRGLGIGPTDPCYDPNRPTWLPTWISTPSESACLWGAYPGVTTLAPVATPPAQAAPAAPQTQPQMTVAGAWTPEMSEAATTAQSQAQAQQFFTQLAASPNYGATPTQCDPSAQSWIDPSTWCANRWMVVGLVGLGLGVLLMRGGR